MKISRDLPQFEKETALIVATGTQDGNFYLAGNGNLEHVVYFKTARPDYSDKGGVFGSSGKGGQVYGVGSVLDYTKFKMSRDFCQSLIKTLDSIDSRHKINSIYFFAPKTVWSELKKELPGNIQKKFKVYFEGVFCHKHPTELLRKIKKDQNLKSSKADIPLKDEAKKLLDRRSNWG